MLARVDQPPTAQIVDQTNHLVIQGTENASAMLGKLVERERKGLWLVRRLRLANVSSIEVPNDRSALLLNAE